MPVGMDIIKRNSDLILLSLLCLRKAVSACLQHYKEKLDQYEKEEQFLLDRIAQCSKLLDSSNRSAVSFFSRTGHFFISISVHPIHGPKGM
jgi:hypothetical protein